MVRRYRSRVRIYFEILSVIQEEGKAPPTHILYKANLSHKRLQKYLEELMVAGAIEELEEEGVAVSMDLAVEGLAEGSAGGEVVEAVEGEAAFSMEAEAAPGEPMLPGGEAASEGEAGSVGNPVPTTLKVRKPVVKPSKKEGVKRAAKGKSKGKRARAGKGEKRGKSGKPSKLSLIHI